ncbi:ATP-binding protein [Kaarinaea lacus]
MNLRALHQKPSVHSALALLTGAMVTLALLGIAILHSVDEEKSIFNGEVNLAYEKISQQLASAEEAAHGLAALFNVETAMNADKFRAFTHEMLKPHTFVESVFYAAKTRGSQHSTISPQLRHQQLLQQKSQHFSSNTTAENKQALATPDKDYFPVLYIEPPLPINIAQIGKDLYIDARLHAAIDKAIDSAQAVTSLTPSSANNKTSFQLLLGTYSGNPMASELDNRYMSAYGVIGLQLNITSLLEDIDLSKSMFVELKMQVPQLDAPTKLYSNLPAIEENYSHNLILTNLVLDLPLNFPGQSLQLSLRKPLLWAMLDKTMMFAAILIGIVISILIFLVVRTLNSRTQDLSQRHQQVQHLVDEKTKTLALEKEKLQKEIDERRKAEQESLRLSRILNETSNEIYIFDSEDLRFIQVNQGALKNLGYSDEEILQLTPVDIKPEHTNESFREFLEPLLTGKKSRLVFETIHERKDGSQYPVEVRLQISQTRKSPVFVAVIEDISERKKVDQELQEYRWHLEDLVTRRTIELQNARDEAIDASRAKSRFLMNMSHELRTPLNAIIGYSELLFEELGDQLDSNSQQDLNRIKQSGEHLLSLINDLLDLSKIESGKMDICLEPVDIKDVLASVETTAQPLIKKNHNKFEIHCPDDIGQMYADQKRLKQILINIVGNAAKFTEEGSISVVVDKVFENNQEWICFAVKDTGIGIDIEQLEKLFKEFQQVHYDASGRFGGSGLGLAISHKFCEYMGGNIKVESEHGHGSVFTVCLPISEQFGQSQQSTAASNS